MPLLKVTGVPIAPAGKTLASATLSVRFLETYADGVYSYPRLHEAVLSFNHTRWEDLNNERFRLPGSALYSLLAPPCILVERQIYEDGGSQTFQRGPLRIVETSPGEWHYAASAPDALIVTTADAPVPQALLASQLGQPGGPAALDADGRLNASIIRGLEELAGNSGESGFTDFYYLQNGTKIFVANYATVPSNRKLLHGYKNAKILVDNSGYWNDTDDNIGFGINEISESSRGEGVHHVKVVSLADETDFIEATFTFVLDAQGAPEPAPENTVTSYDIGRSTGGREVDGSRTIISSLSALVNAFNNGGRCYLRGGTYNPSSRLELGNTTLDIEGYPGETAIIDGSNCSGDLVFLRGPDNNRLAWLTIRNAKGKSIDIFDSRSNVIEYCTVHNGAGIGIHNSEADDNVYRYNEIYNMSGPEGTGILLHTRPTNDDPDHIAQNNKVYGNIVSHCAAALIDAQRSQTSEIYDNVCLFSGRHGLVGGYPFIASDSERNTVSKNSRNAFRTNIVINGAGSSFDVANNGGGGGQTWSENVFAALDEAGEWSLDTIFRTYVHPSQDGGVTNNSVTSNYFYGNPNNRRVSVRSADEDVNNDQPLSAGAVSLLVEIAQADDAEVIYAKQAELLFELFGGKTGLSAQGNGGGAVNSTYSDTRTEADIDQSYGQISTVSELEDAADRGGDYYVRDGVYRLNQALRCDGKRLNLEGYPGETAIIDGSNMYEYDNESQNSLNPDLNDDSGGYASSDLIHIRNADNSRLAYLTFTESPNRNINFLRTDNFTVIHCDINRGGREGIWAAECDGGLIEFNTIYQHADFHENGENGDCIKFFSKYNGEGDCRNITVRNNWMHDASDDIIDMWTSLDCLIDNNVMHTGKAQHHFDPEPLEEIAWIVKAGSAKYPEKTLNSGNKVKRNVCFSGGVGGVQNNGAGGVSFIENVIEQHYVDSGNNCGIRSQSPSGAANCVVEDNYVFGTVERRYNTNRRTTFKGNKNEELPASAGAVYDDLKALCLSGSATLAQVLSKRDELMSELY